MGDASLHTPDSHSLNDYQKHEVGEQNLAGENQTNSAKDLTSVAKVTLPELPELTSSEDGGLSLSKLRLDTVPLQNGFHVGMEKESTTYSRVPCMLESICRSKQQLESETAQVDPVSVYVNGSIIGNDLEIGEKASNRTNFRESNPVSACPQKGAHEATDERIGTQSPENAQDFKVPEKPLNEAQNCMEQEFSVVDIDCQSTYTNHSISLSDNLKEAIIKTNRAATSGENKEDSNAGSRAPSDIEKTKQSGLENSTQRLDETYTGLKSPLMGIHISTESNSDFSHDNMEVLVSPAVNESYPDNKITTEAGGISEGLPTYTSTEKCKVCTVTESKGDQSFNTTKQEGPSEETGITALVSTDMEGWQRFDVEENDANVALAHVDNTLNEGLELWEQLLEDGLEVSEKDVQNPISYVGSVVGLESYLHEGDQFWLASPGNPFIEGLDRMSNFSEAECFIRNGNLPTSQPLHNFEADTSLHAKEGPFQNANDNKDSLSGMLHDTAKSVGEKLTSQLEVANQHGSKPQRQPSYPSFSDLRRSPLDSMEPFEAPSFSLVDLKSYALFKESMTAYQGSSNVYGQENGGDKWEANFDLMVPSAHEITRSLSLPRVTDEVQGQGQRRSFSVFSKEAQITSAASKRGSHPLTATPKSRPSGILSPKLSPLVKKVVDKVRTTPVVANKVLNTVHQVKSLKTADKKPTQKSIWTRCICCSHTN